MELVNREFTLGEMKGITNTAGKMADSYLPRKCSATSRILGPTDRSSVQVSVPEVDNYGRAIRGNMLSIIAISGYIRTKGRSDFEIEKILRAKGIYPIAYE